MAALLRRFLPDRGSPAEVASPVHGGIDGIDAVA